MFFDKYPKSAIVAIVVITFADIASIIYGAYEASIGVIASGAFALFFVVINILIYFYNFVK